MIDPEKYVTMKREDYEALRKDAEYLAGWSPHTENHSFAAWDEAIIRDARVIRDQDFFAASAYYAYAHHIRGMVELLEQLDYSNIPHVIVNGGILPSLDHLQEIADYFMSAAEVAEANPNRKLPT